jgi:hypothetical protein
MNCSTGALLGAPTLLAIFGTENVLMFPSLALPKTNPENINKSGTPNAVL